MTLDSQSQIAGALLNCVPLSDRCVGQNKRAVVLHFLDVEIRVERGWRRRVRLGEKVPNYDLRPALLWSNNRGSTQQNPDDQKQACSLSAGDHLALYLDGSTKKPTQCDTIMIKDRS